MAKGKGRIGLVIALGGVLAAGAFVALAQDFKAFRSLGSRTGMTQMSPATTSGTIQSTFNNAGRAFLRWWNPVQTVDTILDNDQTITGVGANPGGFASQPTGTWLSVTPTYGIFAAGYEQQSGIVQPYRMTKCAAQTAGTSDPRSGASAVYRWTFNNLTAGQTYRVSLNIPIGPTLTSFTSMTSGDYPQRYYVADVQGDTSDVNGTDIEVIDTFQYGGGWVRLGAGGAATDRLFTAPSSGVLTINLYNTVPRNSDGQFLDQDALPGTQWVYADAVKLEATLASQGGYTAQPVVGQLAGGTAPSDPVMRQRTYAARNEVLASGRLVRDVTMGALTSYIYNGATADTGEPDRLNAAWSWPVKRPVGYGTTETQRYATARENWLYGPVAGNERHTFRSMEDNTFSQVSLSGAAFTAGTGTNLGTFIGPDALSAPAVPSTDLSAATGAVQYTSNIPNGFYHIQVYIPPSATVSKATGAIYGVYAGGTLIDTLNLNQASSSGWVTLPGQPTAGYEQSDATGPLKVYAYNLTSGSAGEVVIADAVRWLAGADLSITSTPALADVTVNTGSGTSDRDVVVVPMEDGRIYCLDAVGDQATGEAPATYWTYPSPNPAADPNSDPAEDGGVAEQPTGFGASAPLVARVGSDDLLYIGGRNGRVYCLEMTGRGDGTTRRRWSWPSDYSPTDPTGAREAPLAGGIVSSVTMGQVNGVDAVFVATMDGRVIALDAAGTSASKTTTVLWTYNPGGSGTALEAIQTTPVYAFGRLYINASYEGGSGKVIALNTADGTVAFTSATDFAGFGKANMIAIPGTELVGSGAQNGADMIVVGDSAGRVEALNPEDLTTLWSTTEITGGVSGSLGFTYMTAADTSGVYETKVPAVLCPSGAGSLVALYADGRNNKTGTKRIWQYNLEQAPITSVATGGWRSTELRSWIYAGDSAGILYAWNGNDDVSAGVITPGTAPGSQELVENEPGYDDLSNVINSNNFILLSPDGYEKISTGLLDNTLTPASVVSIAAANKVSRRTFEYGETLYVLIHSLPDLGTGQEYIIESILTTSGAGIRRQVPVRDVSTTVTPGANSKLWVVAIPILPNVNGSAPGVGTFKVRVTLTGKRTTSQEVDLPYTDGTTLATGNIRIANPLGVEFPRSDAAAGLLSSRTGVVTDAYNVRSTENGSGGVDTGSVNGPRPETMTGSIPGGFFGPDSTATGDLVAHAAAGSQRMNVFDRTLSFLIFGPGRGLPNVRMSGGDLAWQIRTPGGSAVANNNVYRPLSDNGVNYPGFEDLPGSPNRSLDYPDIGRSAMSAARTKLSRVENPMFGVVSLTPPQATDADLNTYRSASGFDSQLTRVLSATPFDLALSVPKFQPASGPAGSALSNRPGYKGVGEVYVDVGDQTPGYTSTDAHRTIGMAVRVAPDERLVVGSPVIDLGSMPAGAGYNGGPAGPLSGTRTAADPLDPSSVWNPRNSEFSSQFTSYTLYNSGNVNLLNVRLARGIRAEGTTSRVFAPSGLTGQGMPQSIWLNPADVLHTDLDAYFSPTRGIDAQGRVFLQKPRPGDAVSTRLSTNPVRRVNGNLGYTSGSLVDSTAFPTGDPKVGASIPFGTPTGQYRGTLYPIDDSGTGNDSDGSYNPGGSVPVLGARDGLVLTPGNYEPFAEPGLTVTLNVRESRLTGAPTAKSPITIDANPVAQPGVQWDNTQASGVRAPNGSILVAWASNRVDASNSPAFNPRARTTGDASVTNSRIYIARMAGSTATPSYATTSPLELHSQFPAPYGQRFFQPLLTLPDAATANPATLFQVPSGYTIDPASVNFGSPVMDSRAGAAGAGTTPDSWFVAFIGTAVARDGSGNSRTISNIFVARVSLTGLVNVDASNAVFAYGANPFSTKTGLAVVQQGANFMVVYTDQASGGGQLMAFTQAAFSGGGSQQAIRLATAGFDRISAPSAHLRSTRSGGASTYAVDVVFSARRLGRPNSEVFIGRMGVNSLDGINAMTSASQNYFAGRSDELVRGSDGVYWAPGVAWQTDADSLNAIQLAVVRNGVTTPIITPGSGYFDANSGIVSFDTSLGGRVSMDTRTGLVQFRGSVFPSQARIQIQYSPTYFTVSTARDANYRSVRATFDQGLIPGSVQYDSPLTSERDEIGYLFNEGHIPISVNNAVRRDRLVMAFSRTSADSTGSARGYSSTMRFGVKLPSSVAVVLDQGSAYGTIPSSDFAVNFTSGPGGAFNGSEVVPAGFRTYEIDPVSGNVYFQTEAEGRRVAITYRGVDASGRDLGLITVEGRVQLVQEQSEQPIPMEQPANESGFFLMGDAAATPTPPSGYVRVYAPTRYWMVWTSSRTGNLDIYLQAIAPRLYARPPVP